MNGRLKHRKGKSEGNKGMRNILFKNNNYSSNNNTRLKTTYYNNNKTKINMKIINKKNANKREEILNTINKNEPYTIFRSSGLPPINFQKSIMSICKHLLKHIFDKYFLYVLFQFCLIKII